MNVVDSGAWLEYFTDGANAGFFAPAIEDTASLLVPVLSLSEVFRHILRQRSETDALRAIALMRQGRCLELTEHVALGAAQLSIDLTLPLTASVMLYAARSHGATLWTQDARFESLAGVRYMPAVVSAPP